MRGVFFWSVLVGVVDAADFIYSSGIEGPYKVERVISDGWRLGWLVWSEQRDRYRK